MADDNMKEDIGKEAEFDDGEFEEEYEERDASPSGRAGREPGPTQEAAPRDMLDAAADVPVQIVAVMGKKSITMRELVLLKLGDVIELARPANEVVDLVVGGKLFAKGELVDVDGKLGVRIVRIIR